MHFIKEYSSKWAVNRLCNALKVTEAGYYKFLRVPEKPDKHEALLAQIHHIIQEEPENANYGVQRLYLALRNNYGYEGSLATVYRVCRENNLLIHRKTSTRGITKADASAQKAENLLQQDFTAAAPNQKWLTDITEIPCNDGKLYLVPILDCYDGSIVAFDMAEHMKAELCTEVFKQACRKENAQGMIIHSDRGSQFTSSLFRAELSKHGAIQSMSGVGRCYDNARMESFFATLKKEKLYQMDTRKMSKASVRTAVYRYIHYYNLRRIYSTNDGWPPQQYRQQYYAQLATAN